MKQPAEMSDDELIAEWEVVGLECGEDESERCKAIAEEMAKRDLSF